MLPLKGSATCVGNDSPSYDTIGVEDTLTRASRDASFSWQFFAWKASWRCVCSAPKCSK